MNYIKEQNSKQKVHYFFYYILSLCPVLQPLNLELIFFSADQEL